MKKDLIISICAHVIVVLLILFGRLPSRSLESTDLLIPIEIVDIGEVTQSNKPQQATEAKPEPKAVEKPKEEAKPEPSPQPEAKPLPPVTEEKTPDPIKEEVKPEEPEPSESETEEPVEEEVVEEEPEEVLEEETPEPPKEPEPKKEEKPKPPSVPKVKPKAPKKEEPEAKPEKKKNPKQFESVLKNILKTGGTTQSEAKETAEEEEESGAEDGDDLPKGKEMTISERDAVIQQLRKCWHFDTGMKNANQLVVPIRILMNPDATVKRAEAAEPEKMSDPFYAAAVQRALNAVRNPACTPLKLPKNKYATWKDLIIDFDPSKM